MAMVSPDSFDAEAILETLLATRSRVEKLRDEEDQRLQAAVDRADKLSERYMCSVQILQQETDQVLHAVHDLQGAVGSIGAKAITMGRHLDKMDQEHRRARDAAQVIRCALLLCFVLPSWL